MSRVLLSSFRKRCLLYWTALCLLLVACGPTATPVARTATPALALPTTTATQTQTPTTAYDSEYSRVQIRRMPGMYYDVSEGEVMEGTLTLGGGDAAYWGTVVALGNPETDACLEDVPTESCLIGAPFGPLAVGQDKLDELQALIAKVPPMVCVPDPEILCDPGVILIIEVNRRSARADCCGTLNADFSRAFGQLARFLDQLAAKE